MTGGGNLTGAGMSRRAVLVAGAAGIVGAASLLGPRLLGRPSGAAPSATPASAPILTPSPANPVPSTVATPSPALGDRAGAVAEVEAQVAAHLAGTRTHAAVAVVDRVTGTALTVNGTTLTKSQQDLARPMITMSDNAAASRLWQQIDAATGLLAANRMLGMTETTPGTGGAWGVTTTTVADQRRLLQAVTDPAGPLSAGHREYLLYLMGHVIDSQDWGVPAAATPQTTARQVKNGWMPFTAQNGRWTVNSIGRIVEPGHDWLAVVLSDRNPSQGAGITTVEAAVRLAINGLRTATTG